MRLFHFLELYLKKIGSGDGREGKEIDLSGRVFWAWGERWKWVKEAETSLL